tara:strand:+ start:56121 stop:58037 length:1917 start_codon:yes stop_codon:yes gene_type:complete
MGGLINMMHEHNTLSQHKSPKSNIKAWNMHTTDNRAGKVFWLKWAMLVWVCLIASPTVAQSEMDASKSLDAYVQVQQWVRDWDVPGVNDPEIHSVSTAVAIVTLRLDGKVIGRGSSASFKPSTRHIWEATKGAIERASAKLTGDHDAMWDEFISEMASQITIAVELAETIVPMSESELTLPGFGYTPGVLGVGVSRGDRLEVLGPESMLIQNTDMTQAAMALANGLAGDGSMVLMDPKELASNGFSFYRFEPVVLAQPGVSMGASFIDRGGRFVAPNEIRMSTIGDMSRNIARHLIGRRWAGVEGYGFMGTLDPVTGKSESMFASAFEQAISAYALLRFGELGDTEIHRESILTGVNALRDLSKVEDGEELPWESDVGSCMTVIALAQIQLIDILGDEKLNALRLRTLDKLDSLYAESTGFDESVPEGSHGLVVHAIVQAAKLDPRDRTTLARSAMRRVFDETPVPALVAQMPFLGWAQQELESDASDESMIDALNGMRGLVWEHQLKRDDLEWSDRDLAGGIVFTSSSTPLPSWLSLRPLAFVATMLGDEKHTPGTAGSGEVPVEIGRLIDAVRYVRQLCATDEVLHLYASPESAKWGVRKALWDQRMPIEADALALLSLTETTRSFRSIMGRTGED